MKAKLAFITFNPIKLAELAKSKVSSVRIVVAKNPATPEDILGDLVNNDPDENVRKTVVDNPYVQKLLAQAGKTTSSEVIVSLSQKPFPCVRAAVAQSSFAPVHVLKNLAHDNLWGVRLDAAKNQNTPWNEVAFILSTTQKDQYEKKVGVTHEGSWDFVDGICPPIKVPVDIIETRESYINKSLEVAGEILEKHDANREKIMGRLTKLNPALWTALREVNLANISTDSQELTRLAESESPVVRKTVAKNPHTPWEIVAIFLGKFKIERQEHIYYVELEEEELQLARDATNCPNAERQMAKRTSYKYKGIELAKEILNIHKKHQEKIMQKLARSNPLLIEALNAQA